MNPVDPVRRQLDVYDAHDTERFVAEYADDVKVFRPPATGPILSGKQAFKVRYAKNRFALPNRQSEVVNRIVAGNIKKWGPTPTLSV
ncbi:MAG: hypothetical protein EAZ43_06570 [Betaproteobacteria bacterium]|nr:MAG: hypothetical protein EAZ43_06570 [Betaproteobacteria bacterium]